MNRRQEKKKFKNKFRILYANFFRRYCEEPVKPSRIKLKTEENEKGYVINGTAAGYELKIKLYKEVDAN